MISSQLLLTGFVIYWLSHQFRDERHQLHTGLKHEYLTTHEQLLDSLLLKDLITPTLNDTVLINMNVTSNKWIDKKKIDIIGDNRQPDISMEHIHVDSVPEGHVIALRLKDDSTCDSNRIDSSLFTRGTGQEMLVRSVKLFINQADESYRIDPSAHIFSMEVDPAAFQLELNDRFRRSGWNFFLEPMDADISVTDIEMLQAWH